MISSGDAAMIDLLTDALSVKLGISEDEAKNLLSTILTCIISALKEGKQVNLRPLGRFEVVVHPSREAIKQGGEHYKTEEKRLLAFYPSKGLKEHLAKGAR